MASTRDRVISVVLDERDWQAFVRLHPQPSDWLRAHIQELIANGSVTVPARAADAASTTSATTR